MFISTNDFLTNMNIFKKIFCYKVFLSCLFVASCFTICWLLSINRVNHLMKFSWGMSACYPSFCSCTSPVCCYFISVACGARYRRSSYAVRRKYKTLATAYHLHRTSDKKKIFDNKNFALDMTVVTWNHKSV